MKKLALAVAIGGAMLLAGCSSDSGSDEAADKAAAAAEAAQEQVAELEGQVQQQSAELKQQKRAAKAAARKAKKKARASAQPQAAVAESPSGPPNVVGLSLTAAESEMEAAGYQSDAENTDTMFGIVNTDNFTVCTQDPPRGNVVHVLAQKYGC